MIALPGAIRKAVLDTGPLLSALVVNFLDKLPDQSADRSCFRNWQFRPPLLSRGGQRQLLGLIAGLRDRRTTAHVMAEISALSDSKLKLRGPYAQLFWQWSIDLLTQWNLDERLIRLIESAPSGGSLELLVETGLTDFSVIELARREGFVLITEDEPLSRRASREGIDCRLLSALITV